jgi:hypothetical protein
MPDTPKRPLQPHVVGQARGRGAAGTSAAVGKLGKPGACGRDGGGARARLCTVLVRPCSAAMMRAFPAAGCNCRPDLA